MRQIAGKGEFLCRAVRAERFDENEEGSYNRHRKGAAGRRSAPAKSESRNPA